MHPREKYPYIKALHEGLTFISDEHGDTVIRYRFAIPQKYQNYLNKTHPQYDHRYRSARAFNETEMSLFQNAMQEIMSYIKVQFVEAKDDDANLEVFALDIEQSADKSTTGQADYTSRDQIIFKAAIWFYVQSLQEDLVTKTYVTMLHELLHVLGLEHPFEEPGRQFFLTGEETLKLYSIMNYNQHATVRPAGLTRWDIAAIQSLYPPNFETSADDSLYYLEDTHENLLKPAIWDGGGKNTMTAERCGDMAKFELREPDGLSFSQCNTSYTAIAGGVDIHNIIGGPGGNVIHLNSGKVLNQTVYLPPSCQKASDIYVDPKTLGFDIVIGFKPGLDRLLFVNTEEDSWKLEAFPARNVTIHQAEILAPSGMCFIFSNENKICVSLSDVASGMHVYYQTQAASKFLTFDPRTDGFDPKSAPVRTLVKFPSLLEVFAPMGSSILNSTMRTILMNHIDSILVDLYRNHKWTHEEFYLARGSFKLGLLLSSLIGGSWQFAAVSTGATFVANCIPVVRYASAEIGMVAGYTAQVYLSPAGATLAAFEAATDFGGKVVKHSPFLFTVVGSSIGAICGNGFSENFVRTRTSKIAAAYGSRAVDYAVSCVSVTTNGVKRIIKSVAGAATSCVSLRTKKRLAEATNSLVEAAGNSRLCKLGSSVVSPLVRFGMWTVRRLGGEIPQPPRKKESPMLEARKPS